MRTYVIEWSRGMWDCKERVQYATEIRIDTRGRRSRRARRAVRAARCHEQDVAQRLLFQHDLPPIRLAVVADFQLLHRRFAPRRCTEAHVYVWRAWVRPSDHAIVVGPPPDGRSVAEHLDELSHGR